MSEFHKEANGSQAHTQPRATCVICAETDE